MKAVTKRTLFGVAVLVLVLAVQGSANAPVLPNPVLYFLGQEFLTINGKQVTRYNFDVLNKSDYPDNLFEASPNLPPCGKNTKAARTWVDIYDQSGKRLNGFCALGKSADLYGICFSLDTGVIPPRWVYI
jgi:hypothetical protein